MTKACPANPPKRGIIIPVPRQYQSLCLENIEKLRAMGCDLPIEIWEIGEEITAKFRLEYEQDENISFKQVKDYCDNPQHWKGFQIKAFCMYHSQFEETLLCDADVIIHQNPICLFEDEDYRQTGAYFFKDLEKWQFKQLRNPLVQLWQRIAFKKFKNAKFFLQRKAWLRSLLPEQSPLFPKEWSYIYEEDLPTRPVKEALQESGVVLMHRTKHQQSLEYLYQLNEAHEQTYQYVWGDKETFWIACVLANQAFTFNASAGYRNRKDKVLRHDYKGALFFSQKGN